MSSPLDNSARTLMGDALPPKPRPASPFAKDLIFAYRGSQFVLLLVGVIFTAVGLPMTTIFCWGIPADVRLNASGVAAQATVKDTGLNTSVEVNGENPTTVHFEYVVNGQTYADKTDTLDDTLIARAAPGAALPIEYLASDPSVARLQGETRATFGYWAGFTLLFPLLGVALTASAVRSNRREIRAYRYGDPVDAVITSYAEDTSTEMNGKHPWLLEWQFTVDGKTYTGKLSTMRKNELQPWADAKNVTVLMLPEDPSVNTLYVP